MISGGIACVFLSFVCKCVFVEQCSLLQLQHAASLNEAITVKLHSGLIK